MDEPARGERGGRWGTAIALTLAVLFFSVFNALPLVVLPLAVLLLAIPAESRGRQAALGVLLALAAVALPGGPLTDLSRGWALVIGALFLTATLKRPDWGVFPRAFAAIGAAVALSALILVATGQWAAVDATVREHFASASALALESFGSRVGDPDATAQWRSAMEMVARVQWLVFPALLVFESLAALALAAWWMARVRGGDAGFRLRPLREFRFDDQLVWLLIAGLVLVVAPLGAVFARIGYNALLVMAGLYALRGAGVFLFLAGGAPPLLAVAVGAVVTIFLYPLVLSAAVLVGLGDTWLDVRGRAAAAPPRT